MAEDKIKGKLKQIKGKVTEEADKVRGSYGEQIKGKAEQAEGKIQEEIGKVRSKIRKTCE
jgi:uncharacterized protein YjbJ (UPF0337 family)